MCTNPLAAFLELRKWHVSSRLKETFDWYEAHWTDIAPGY